MHEVESIFCENKSFSVLTLYLRNSGGDILWSSDLLVNQCLDLKLAPDLFKEGLEVNIEGKPVMGISQKINESLVCINNGKTAVFEANGTSLDFSINLSEIV